jgi:D-cysteine desulfhydrase family pyridoxal phosphate-dependent enzyme
MTVAEILTLAMPKRRTLAVLPTPLHPLPRLREALGGAARCPRLLMKRDDLTGLALGGNKVRKLEFLVADALNNRATVLVTTGAAQSNHARMTAAAARAVGLDVVLVLTADSDDPPLSGNLLLDRLFGATIHYLPRPADPLLATNEKEDVTVREILDRLAREGHRPYVIPVGGSSTLGVFGYVWASREIAGQLRLMHERPTRLYYASGSRGTQAGLALGAKAFGLSYEPFGVAVSGGESWKRERAIRIANEAADLVGSSIRVADDDLRTEERFIGKAYGAPTSECIEAIELVARCEGILLDPVYTGKAMACLIAHVRAGELDPASTVVFLHTGGVPALFAHAHEFQRA